jgi:Holliday junction resolvasome RuvABC ATP-dependent DNA helicase subunit
MSIENVQEKLRKINEVFTPSAPITTKDFFRGRISSISRAVSAIHERGMHVMVFGERGVGKTSLANIIPMFVGRVSVVKVTCHRSDSLGQIWGKVLRKIKDLPSFSSPGDLEEVDENVPSIYLTSELEEKLIELLKDIKKITSADMIEMVENLQGHTLIILDEFDSIENKSLKANISDAIKNLSDSVPQVTLILVGIGKTVSEIIGDHPSLTRCLREIELERMPLDELKEIIDNGARTLEISFDDDVINDITQFSQGFPHFTHLLAKCSAERAILSNSIIVGREHFNAAVIDAVQDTQESVRVAYHLATSNTRQGTLFEPLVSACALVAVDDRMTFRAVDLQEPLQKLTGKPIKPTSYFYPLGKLCSADKGSLLEKVGNVQRQYRYRFANPLVRAFVLLKIYQTQHLS